MTFAVYWDTSALLKLYAPEQDSDQYRRLLIAQQEHVAISALHDVEFFYALRCKEARGEIPNGSSQQLIASFQQHVREGRYFQIPWGQDLVQNARDALDLCLTQIPPRPLRSLDGLHLGALQAANIQRIVTADIRMQEAATALGVTNVLP
jgi:predicted nucleic acid-binding protein